LLCHRGRLIVIVLVGNFADDLLDDILDGCEPIVAVL